MSREVLSTKKQFIFEEAAKLFRDKGYLATSMRELATKVGLEPSSLYSHIKSKEEILQKICLDNAEKFIEGIEAIDQEKQSPVEKIEALIGLHIKIATEDLTSVTVFNDEWRHLGEASLKEFLSLRRSYESRFRKIIETGIETKAFRAIDSNVALFSILTSLRWIHYWYKPGRKLDVTTLQTQIIDLLLHGLKKD